MRKRFHKWGVRAFSLFLALLFTTTPAFALVREVEVYGVRSINDLGNSDQRIDMEMLYDDYSDFVQTDTLREYFHQDKDAPAKADLDIALSWLIDNNIFSRDEKITVTDTGSGQIPKVNIDKFDTGRLAGLNVMRTDMIMYIYKAAFGPIYGRTVGVETDNIRVDDGEYITLADLMYKNGYTTDPNNTLGGSGTSYNPGGQSGGNGGNGSGGSSGGAGGSGTDQVNQTDYVNDSSNWRYQPQGDLWESIFGDTNIFISQNNFQQNITGGNGGGGGGGGAGNGSGGAGGTSGNTVGGQSQTSTGNVGSAQGEDSSVTTGNNSNNNTSQANPSGGSGGTSTGSGSGTINGDFNSPSGGTGGSGGNTDTGDNYLNYETDYKQIYFIPGADLLVYCTSDIPELYIQAALSKGLLAWDESFRNDRFQETFIDFINNNPNMVHSWEGSSPAYIVNRTRNKLKTVSNTEQVGTMHVLGGYWNTSWQNNTLTIERKDAFQYSDGRSYFTAELCSKMDAYEYIYHFIVGSEKVLSQLESDIVNYKYGMELDGITDEEGTNIIKYLIAKGIINYEVTDEFMSLDSPISWSEFLTLVYRVANKDARYDFSKIQLTDSETQWKAKGYSPQTTYLTPGTNLIRTQVATVEEYSTQNFGTSGNELIGTTSDGIPSISDVSTTVGEDGRSYPNFGNPDDKSYVFTDGGAINDIYFYGLTATFEGAMSNSRSNNGTTYTDLSAAATAFGVSTPTTNLGKYTLSLLYEMAGCSPTVLGHTWTDGYSADEAKFKLMRNVTCNIWAINDMINDSASSSEVERYLQLAMGADSAPTYGTGAGQVIVMPQGIQDRVQSSGATTKDYRAAVTECWNHFRDNVKWSGVSFTKFQFTDGSGNVIDNSDHWVVNTGGSITTLVDTFTGVEMNVKIDNVMKKFIFTTPKVVGVSRTSGSNRQGPWDVTLSCTIAADLINPNLSVEEQERERLLNYNNNITTFSNLEAIRNTPLTTYVEPNTSECYIAWSTIEKYRQTSSSGNNSLPIKKISDFLLLNTDTNTYAYFSNEGDDKKALVGTDVVTCNNDYGVAYREGSEMYYLIDAIRLLMDSKQEASLLGGIRTMPLASNVVQNNITKVSVDNNDGTPTQSLTGVSVLLSDDDTVTSQNLRNAGKSDSVYFTEANVYHNSRWGNFIAISSANRAINAISHQFAYTGKDGTKLTAYAVVIFEPLSASEMGYSTVDATSSLQDLLDAPMKMPESEADQAKWKENKARCNLLANWIYGTTGKEYISTGYLRPHAYIFSSDPDIAGYLTDSDWGCLTTKANTDAKLGSERELVEIVRLYQVINGAIDKFGATHNYQPDVVRNNPDHQASYMLSADYQICILGNRVYLNFGCFKNMQKVSATKLRASNIVMGSAGFTVGSTFKTASTAGVARLDGYATPKITVIKTETNGTVTCQVGPIYGLPLLYGTNNNAVVIHSPSSNSATVQETDWSLSANNQIQYIFELMFQAQGQAEEDTYPSIELLGLSSSPILDADSTRNFVFNGSKLITFKGQAKTSKDAEKSIPTVSSATVVSSIPGIYAGSSNNITAGGVETYFNIKFDAFKYSIENGVLKYRPNQASDFISPSLFTSLNDLIIDGMMNADNGAIPIEQVPFGSVIQIGTGWYVAYGTSEDDIAFVGYAPLNGFSSSSTFATIQDASKSFATQFIRAGNQQLNISHFFERANVLTSLSGYDGNLDILNTSKMAEDTSSSKMYILGAESNTGTPITGPIYTSPTNSANTFYYAPVDLAFQKGILKAYKTSADGVEPAVYTICSSADTAVTGPFDDLSFFSDNALSGSMSDRTTSANSGGFIQFYGAQHLMDNIHADFQKAFAGDLFTLTRMLVFIVLIWLVVASWVCYGTYFGGLMPILDAIKHPTGNQTGNGVDLMKIVSLGSISLETDFKLGRFIQYNFVLAALLCVVYISGIYL